jgi:glycyl-tRNA synthetase beta subunit
MRVKNIIDEADIKETYTINTFGYGKDHDSGMMNNIATFKNGTFNYIENIKKASEYFVLSMSGMLNTFAHNVKVVLEEIRVNEGFKVKKVYGEFWTQSMDQKS